jgi:probable F420-dependent oxidoreductase
MKIGLVFPQTEFGSNASEIKDYTQTAEGLGFSHILAYDHVLGANPNHLEKFNGPYTFLDSFLSPLVLFSYMSAITETLEFATGIIILPQRQTALFAKQAATLDQLCSGRLRLGVGIGWNRVEYQALDKNFHNRGRRIEEQVQILRLLWQKPLINFFGEWESIPDAGLNPLPIQKPIPIWFGGHAKPVLERAGRLGDGWMPNYREAAQAKPSWDLIRETAEKNGRDSSKIGLEARINYETRIKSNDKGDWIKIIQTWNDIGANHISFNTMNIGLNSPKKHIQAIKDIANYIGLSK